MSDFVCSRCGEPILDPETDLVHQGVGGPNPPAQPDRYFHLRCAKEEGVVPADLEPTIDP